MHGSTFSTFGPSEGRNFFLWALIPYIAALSGEALMDRTVSFEPVSYTHLDVYKRQVLTRLVLIILLSAAFISLAAAFLHKWRDVACARLYYKIQQIFSEKMIDVYKRQC